MDKKYFSALEERLNDGYYIVVCCGVNNSIICYLLKDNARDVSVVNGGLVAGLVQMTSIISEDKVNIEFNKIIKSNLIDKIITKLNYTVHFYKLANKKVLTCICRSYKEEYIPIKSLITDDIMSGIEMLDGVLRKMYEDEFKEDFIFNFHSETYQHFNDVVEYRKNLTLVNK